MDKVISEWESPPLAILVHDAFFSKQFPLWNPFNGLGSPLPAHMAVGMYAPFHWPVFLSPSLETWEFSILLRIFVCGTGTYIFLRSCQIRSWVAFFIAALYMVSGHLFYYGNGYHINGLALTPFFLYAIQLVFRGKYKSSLFPATLSLGFMMMGGGVVEALLTAVLTGIVGMIWILLECRSSPLHVLTKKIIYFVFICVLGVGLAGIFIFPFLELHSLALPRWPGRSATFFNSWQYGLSLFFHKLTLTPPNASTYYMEYRQHLSIFLLLGIVWAILHVCVGRRYQQIWFIALSLYASIYFGKLYGVALFDFLNHVPILQDVRFEKYVGLAYFSLYILAAFGLEWTLNAYPRYKIRYTGIATIAVSLLPLWYVYVTYSEITSSARVYALTYCILLLAMGYLFCFRQSLSSKALILGCFFLGCIGIAVDYNSDFLGSARGEMFPKSKLLSQLKNRMSKELPTRIFSTGAPPKLFAPYHLEDIRDMGASLLPRYADIFRDGALNGKVMNFHAIFASNEYESLQHDLLSFLNVGYFIVSNKKPPVAGHQLVLSDNFSNIYYNPDAFPRAYMIYQISEEPDSNKILKQILHNPKSFLHQAWIDAPLPLPSQSLPKVQHPKNTVRITEYAFDHVTIQVTTNAPGVLILLDQFYPGWTAAVNDHPQTVYRTNYLYRGVLVKAGETEVKFTYQPKSFHKGAILSLCSFVGILILWTWIRKKRGFLW
ncbi:MAG: YfhO family protein [SAR324 cluster bacterium]|nr:YfhO family protein [SAR324 cluster bacterium]